MKRTTKAKPKTAQPHIEVAVLEVTTWANSGVVLGAEHYYGKIKGSLAEKEPRSEFRNWDTYVDLEVNYAIDKTEARKLNKEAKSLGFGSSSTYKVGDESTRFFSEEKMIATAIEVARKLGYDALLIGSSATCSPQRMLYGPKMDELNAIWARHEKLYDDTNDPPKTLWQPIEDEWTALAFAAGVGDENGGVQFHRR